MKKTLLASLFVASIVGYSSFAWAEPQANGATAHEEHQHGGHEKTSPQLA